MTQTFAKFNQVQFSHQTITEAGKLQIKAFNSNYVEWTDYIKHYFCFFEANEMKMNSFFCNSGI